MVRKKRREPMTDTKITITPEEAAALWDQFCEDREAAFRPHRHDNDRTAIKHALSLAIARERAKYEPLTNLNEDGLGPAITMRPSEARPLLQQFRYDVKNILSQIKTAFRDEQIAKDIAIEIAVTDAVQREQGRCLSIIREVNALNADDPRLIVSKRALEEIEKRIRGEE